MQDTPVILKVKGGWAAIGKGWAVHAETQEAAMELFQRRLAAHEEVEARSDPVSTEAGAE